MRTPKPAYARYIHIAKMTTNKEGAFHLLVSLSMDLPVVNTLRTTHLDDFCLYNSIEKNILLMIQATEAFMKKTASPLLSMPASYTTM